MKETLEKIKQMIIEQDPDDGDKFLRKIYYLCEDALRSVGESTNQ